MEEYKICVVGSGETDKSDLARHFVLGTTTFRGYDPTVEDAYKIERVVDGKPVVLDILDTAGMELLQFSVLHDMCMCGNGFVLVYSITSQASFKDLISFRKRIFRAQNLDTDTDTVPLVLAGNKCHLEEEREVSREQGEALAAAWRCSFIEASSETGHNVEEVFMDVANQICRKNRGKYK